MHADTDAIRGHSKATTHLSTDIHAAAALLRRDLSSAIIDAFGPSGARFAAALTDAAARLATTVTNIGNDVGSSADATAAAAARYDNAEAHARTQIASV